MSLGKLTCLGFSWWEFANRSSPEVDFSSSSSCGSVLPTRRIPCPSFWYLDPAQADEQWLSLAAHTNPKAPLKPWLPGPKIASLVLLRCSHKHGSGVGLVRLQACRESRSGSGARTQGPSDYCRDTATVCLPHLRLLAYFKKINRFFSFEQFEVYRQIEQKVEFPFTSLTHSPVSLIIYIRH